jgi:hypothetical protein
MLEQPKPGAVLHRAITLKPNWSGTANIVDRPDTLRGVLTLDAPSGDSKRMTGSIALFAFEALTQTQPSSTAMAAAAGQVDEGTLTLEPGTVVAEPGATLQWTQLELQPGGTGTASGHWSRVLGDVVDQTDFTAKVTWGLDMTGELLRLVPAGDRPAPDLLPTDTLRVMFDEPVAEPDARARVKLLAGGAPWSSTWSADLPAVSARVVALQLQPDHFLPFGAELTLAPGGLTDPAGNALVAGAARHVVADPGPLTSNAGFESGLAGWITSGQVEATGAVQGQAPAEGAKQLVVHQESFAAGYLDVPANATTLQLSLTLFSELGQFDAGKTAVVRLLSEGVAPQVLFDAATEQAHDAACNCGELSHRLGPQVKTADLTALRGKRVFLTAEVRSAFFIGVNYYALLIDDVRVQ